MDRIQGDRIYEGTVTYQGTVNHKTGSVLNQHVGANASAPIDAEKLEREFLVGFNSAIGSAVAAFDQIVHIAQAAGEVVDVEIVCETVPTGDNTLTVDVQLWTGAAWASVLDAAEVVDSGYAAKTPQVVTLASSSETYADGDLLRITGTLGGSTGAHAQGVRVQVRLREKP